MALFSLLSAVLLASLLGSLHCLGMCGPFALIASGSGMNAPPVRNRLAVLAGYHAGRLMTYLLFGLVAGAAGAALNWSTQWAGWQRAATTLAGTLMIAAALVSLARHFGWIQTPATQTSRWIGALHLGMRSVQKLPKTFRAAAIGFLTTWMPCGWLYVFALAAAGTASPWWGAVVMFTFWMGTIPILVLLVWGGGWLAKRTRWNLKPWLAAAVLAIGCLTLSGRTGVNLQRLEVSRPRGIDEARQHVQHLEARELPCCASEPSAASVAADPAPRGLTTVSPTGLSPTGTPQ